jgi:hypothetical protein
MHVLSHRDTYVLEHTCAMLLKINVVSMGVSVSVRRVVIHVQGCRWYERDGGAHLHVRRVAVHDDEPGLHTVGAREQQVHEHDSAAGGH